MIARTREKELPGMADRRDRSADIHRRDGRLTKGRVIGHSDAKGRIREADTPLRKGEDLGFVDDKHRIRRRGGLLSRGETLARIRGNAVYANEGLLTSGLRLGHIDERGDVWQADCAAFRGRCIGKARGADPEAALAYFVLKFHEVADHVNGIEEKVRAADEKYAFLPRIRALQRLLPEVDGLGDFDSLVRRLDSLEEACAEDLGRHLPGEREHIRESSSRLTPESTLELLRSELGLDAIPSFEQAEALVGRVRGALGALSEGRGRNRGDALLNEPPPSRPATIPPEPRDPPEEVASRIETLVETAFGPVDKLREEIERIRKDPDYRAEELIDRVRGAMTSLLEHRDVGLRYGLPVPKLPAALRPAEDRNPSSSRPLSRPPSERTALVTPSVEPQPARLRLPAETTGAIIVPNPDEPFETKAFVEDLLETDEASRIFNALDDGLTIVRELAQSGTPIGDFLRAGLGRLRRR